MFIRVFPDSQKTLVLYRVLIYNEEVSDKIYPEVRKWKRKIKADGAPING